MQTYRVAFFKDLANSSGHQSKCLQQELEVEAEDVRQALHLTEAALVALALDIDGVEAFVRFGEKLAQQVVHWAMTFVARHDRAGRSLSGA